MAHLFRLRTPIALAASTTVSLFFLRPSLAAEPLPPAQRRRFSSKDVGAISPGCLHLPRTLVPPGVDAILKSHDVKNDKEFPQADGLSEELKQKALPFLHEQSGLSSKQSAFSSQSAFFSVEINDARFYICHTGSKRGFGLYATEALDSGEVVGVYTGFLNDRVSSDYRWNYQSRVQVPVGTWEGVNTGQGDNMELGVDAEKGGNVLRYINHDEKPNCEQVYMPYANRWHIVYVTNRAIAQDEEMTVSYGFPFLDEPRAMFDG